MKRVKLFLSILVLSSSTMVLAQVDVQNNGTLFISVGSDILYINGALTNTNSGAITNNGNLYVLRNLTNGQVAMPVGIGRLLLNGSVAQTVGGTQPFRTFNLTTNNAAGIILNANLSVSGAHTFTNGIIATSVTPNYLIYEAGSSYSGAADNRHVNGWVKKNGTTNFTFPVGNGTYLRDAAISNLSASSEFNCKHYVTTPNPTNIAAPILLVDNNEYWDLTRVSGGTVDLTLNWDNSKISFFPYPLGNIRVVHYSGGLWTSRGGSASGNVSTTGTITGTGISNFGLHTFGSTDWFVPLQFLTFRAIRKQNYSQLDWSTAIEMQSDRFDIERSDDALQFKKLGEKNASDASGPYKYSFKDYLPLQGTAWYRIKSIDRNGRHSYSSIFAVSDNTKNDKFYIINNPVSEQIYIATGETYAGTYAYSIINASGQVIQNGDVAANAGGITTIALKALITTGTYVLNMQSKTHRLTQKIMVR